jgi:hypothetical protein
MQLRKFLQRLRLRSVRAVTEDGHDESRFEGVRDARVDAAAQGSSLAPPGYVKSYDEGRPPH